MKIQLSEPFFIFTVLKKAGLERYSLIPSLHSYSSYFPTHPTCNSAKSCGTKRPSEKKNNERRFKCQIPVSVMGKKAMDTNANPCFVDVKLYAQLDMKICWSPQRCSILPRLPTPLFLVFIFEYQMFNSHIFSLAPKAYRINHRHRLYAMSALKAHMICLTSKSEYYFIRGRHMNCV